MKGLKRRVALVMSGRLSRVATLAIAVMLCAVSVATATDPLLPDVGVDFAGLILEAGTALGATVTVIVSLYFAFLLVKKSMSWARRAF